MASEAPRRAITPEYTPSTELSRNVKAARSTTDDVIVNAKNLFLSAIGFPLFPSESATMTTICMRCSW